MSALAVTVESSTASTTTAAAFVGKLVRTRPVIPSDEKHMTCHTLSRRSAAGAGVERGVSVLVFTARPAVPS